MSDPAAVLGGDPGRPVSASKIPFPAAVVEREVRARLMPYSGCRAAVICELARAMSDAVARRSELRLQVRPKSLVAHRRPSDDPGDDSKWIPFRKRSLLTSSSYGLRHGLLGPWSFHGGSQ